MADATAAKARAPSPKVHDVSQPAVTPAATVSIGENPGVLQRAPRSLSTRDATVVDGPTRTSQDAHVLDVGGQAAAGAADRSPRNTRRKVGHLAFPPPIDLQRTPTAQREAQSLA